MSMNKKMPKAKSIGARNNKVLISAITLVAILLFGVFLYMFQNMVKTETYYQLAPDVNVAAQEVITESMVVAVVTKEGTAPTNALSIADIQSGYAQAKYPLIANEVLTLGNVGGPTSSSSSLHDVLISEKKEAIENGDVEADAYKNWVLTTFSVPENNAVGGRIKPGDYFDMMVINDQGSFYPFINLKSVDAAGTTTSAGSAQGAEGEAAPVNGNSYTVQLSPKDAARLHWIMNNHSNVMLLLNDQSDIVTEDGVIPADGKGANRYDAYVPSDEGAIMDTISPNINLPARPGEGPRSNNDTSAEVQAEQEQRQSQARSESEETDN